jgi:RNA polymerase sigma factor (TIGR02999 family)
VSQPTPTELLLAWGRGDSHAFDQLVVLVNDELRHIARRYMRREPRGHTLQATALVNEVYLRLVDVNRVHWRSRAHFFAIAARTMRRILVDHARARDNQKRGGSLQRIVLDETALMFTEPAHDLVRLDEALRELEEAYPRKAQVVELRFFGGLTLEETAEAIRVSTDTVKRDWRFAKLWLMRELREGRRA